MSKKRPWRRQRNHSVVTVAAAVIAVFISAMVKGAHAQAPPFSPPFAKTNEPLTIFVTSPIANSSFGAGTPLPNGPLIAAQQFCDQQARSAKLPGSWYPLLSSTTWDAVSVTGTLGTGPIYNIGREVIANNRKALWSGSLRAAVRYQASGVAVGPTSPPLVSGTTQLGLRTTKNSQDFCNNWTSKDTKLQVMTGNAGAVNSSMGRQIDRFFVSS